MKYNIRTLSLSYFSLRYIFANTVFQYLAWMNFRDLINYNLFAWINFRECSKNDSKNVQKYIFIYWKGDFWINNTIFVRHYYYNSNCLLRAVLEKKAWYLSNPHFYLWTMTRTLMTLMTRTQIHLHQYHIQNLSRNFLWDSSWYISNTWV